MVERIGDIHESTARLEGKVDTNNAHHDALKYRIDKVEESAKSAKNWENGKILLLLAVQGLGRIFHA